MVYYKRTLSVSVMLFFTVIKNHCLQKKGYRLKEHETKSCMYKFKCIALISLEVFFFPHCKDALI
jgi:hypothetical protein